MNSLLYGDDDTYKPFNIYTSDEFQTHQQDSLQNHLIRLLQCDNETLCLSSAKLLFDLYQVYYNDTIIIVVTCFVSLYIIQQLFQGESHLFKRSQLAYIVHEESLSKYVVYVNYATFQEDKDSATPVRILLKLLQGEAIDANDRRFINVILYIYMYIHYNTPTSTI